MSDIESSDGPTRYYHLCKTKLGVGSIIEPGNYGEVFQIFGYKHGAFQREMLLEEVRRLITPNAPSRLQCLFVFATPEDARAFQMREFGGFGMDYLYEVEPLENSAPILGQMHALDNWERSDQNAKAHLYWDQSKVAENGPVVAPPGMGVWAGFQEILLGCAVRVVRRMGRLHSE